MESEASTARTRWTSEGLQQRLHDRFSQEPLYTSLMDMRDKGWNNRLGDKAFKKKRRNADNADLKSKHYFFTMMAKIAEQLTGAGDELFNLPPKGRSLDLCMAPGGFTQCVVAGRPDVVADCITLPIFQGGHDVILEPRDGDGSFSVQEADVTMFAKELGAGKIPDHHPEAQSLLAGWPYQDTYDLVICDGQDLRTHKVLPYRQHKERARLLAAQLAIALKRVNESGSILILLHKAELWHSFTLTQQLSQFATVRLYKPNPFHAYMSSYYIVVNGVTRGPAHAEVLVRYQRTWSELTFNFDTIYTDDKRQWDHVDPATEEAFEAFIEEYVQMCMPIFRVQYAALAKQKWTK